MFLIPVSDDHVYGIKPMNCPGHMLLFGSKLRSYRDLPMRYAEGAPLHRNELAGALHGLTRVRYVTQDDAHLFCTKDQIAAELDGCFDYLRYVYGLFGSRAARRALHETREQARIGRGMGLHRGELRSALDRHGVEYALGAGEGSFYGPKIDLHITDVLGRSWQMERSSSTPRCRLASVSHMWAPTTASIPSTSSTARFSLLRALHRHPARAHRRRPAALAGAGAAARDPGGGESRRACACNRRGLAPCRLPGRSRRTRRVGRKRIRDAELEKIPRLIVYGDKESPTTSRARAGRRSVA